jgi:hypothetical protein
MKGEEMEKLTSLQAIRKYFESRGATPVTVEELRDLTPEQRERLGEACARMLGVQRVVKPPQ